jgi:hypothetical protein
MRETEVQIGNSELALKAGLQELSRGAGGLDKCYEPTSIGSIMPA